MAPRLALLRQPAGIAPLAATATARPRLIPGNDRYDRAIAEGLAQCRWWRARGWTPAMVFRAFGVPYRPAQGERPWPSWDQAVWLTAEAWLNLPEIPAEAAIVIGSEDGAVADKHPLQRARVA